MEAIKEKTQLVNGVNTEQLFSTIDLIKENPDIATFLANWGAGKLSAAFSHSFTAYLTVYFAPKAGHDAGRLR